MSVSAFNSSPNEIFDDIGRVGKLQEVLFKNYFSSPIRQMSASYHESWLSSIDLEITKDRIANNN